MQEHEAKLSVDEDFEMPDLDGCATGTGVAVLNPTERLVTDVYYDTADLRLLRWGCTLRHRKRRGWTVKLPIAADHASLTRNEINLGGRAGKPPIEARRLVASFARSGPLIEAATVTTRRTARSLRAPDGATVAEVTDDRVSSETPDGRTATYRQLEVELDPDAESALLGPIVETLTAAGARPEGGGIKLAIALDQQALDPEITLPALPGRPSARDVIHLAIARSVSQLILQLPCARLGEDPEGIHQARVATRRLRSDLRSFKPLLDPTWTAQLQPRLRSLAAQLGEVRDADVLGHRLEANFATGSEIDRAAGDEILAVLDGQRQDARNRLESYLDDPDTVQLLDDLVAAARNPAITGDADEPARDRLPRLVERQWRRLDRAIDALDREPPVTALHEVRTLAKRTRYASEAIAPAFGSKTRRFGRALAGLQNALGDLNDAAVANRWLAENAAAFTPATAFAAGRLTTALDRSSTDGLWLTSWTKIQKRRPSWLR